jgi:hypothetical protein
MRHGVGMADSMVEMARMGMRSVEAEGEGVRKIKVEIKIVLKIKRSQDNCCEYQSLDVLWSAVN